jgi:hypothetical protein
LLGVLAAMPYGQLFGVSDAACDVLRSLVVTVAWAGLNTGRPEDYIWMANEAI